MTPRCPETGLSCATGYNRGCRCDACRAFNSARSDARRRKLGARVQARKVSSTVFCPRTGKTAVTAYGHGCRCQTCRSEATLRRLRRGPLNAERMERLNAIALHAFATDIEYAIRIAEAAAEVYERVNSEGEVSANAA